jgi:hypothetical protein
MWSGSGLPGNRTTSDNGKRGSSRTATDEEDVIEILIPNRDSI